MIEGVKKALERGFTRETQAYLKYRIYAQKAEEEARAATSDKVRSLMLEAQRMFSAVAEEEAGHALYYLRALDEIGDTARNLMDAAEGEQADVVEYAISAAAARVAGMEEVAQSFERIAEIEKRHTGQFAELSERMQRRWLTDRLR
jgi:rubrerythrin